MCPRYIYIHINIYIYIYVWRLRGAEPEPTGPCLGANGQGGWLSKCGLAVVVRLAGLGNLSWAGAGRLWRGSGGRGAGGRVLGEQSWRGGPGGSSCHGCITARSRRAHHGRSAPSWHSGWGSGRGGTLFHGRLSGSGWRLVALFTCCLASVIAGIWWVASCARRLVQLAILIVDEGESMELFLIDGVHHCLLQGCQNRLLRCEVLVKIVGISAWFLATHKQGTHTGSIFTTYIA